MNKIILLAIAIATVTTFMISKNSEALNPKAVLPSAKAFNPQPEPPGKETIGQERLKFPVPKIKRKNRDTSGTREIIIVGGKPVKGGKVSRK